ncbi:hypothetical protein AVP41_02151 [Microbacterium sp. TNHR37B]|nr:hypothetical protein AVP41_02151 [Microbacterium sp. TNHR37B]
MLGGMAAAADDAYEQALSLTNQRRYAEAKEALVAAAEIAEGVDLRARIAGTLSYVLVQTGDPAEGERLCREALDDPALSPHTRGVLAGQLGTLLMNQGRLDEALEWLQLAIDTIPDDAIAVANLRVNRSLIHMQRRDLAASAADLEATLDVFAAQGTPVELAEARHNLGYVALLEGDLVRAMREMAAARPILAGESAANAAISDSDRAEVLRDAGLVTEAERLLAAAAEAFGADGMPQARGEAEHHLAKSLLRHDPVRAEQVAGVAAARFTELGAASWALRADGIRLRARLAGGDMDRSGRLVELTPPGDDGEIDRVSRGLSRAKLHNEADALRLTRELWRARHDRPPGRLPRLASSASLEVRLLAHEVRATRALRAAAPARRRTALRLAADGLEELTAWRSSYGSLDLQASLAMHGQNLLLIGIDAALRTADPALVFEWSERARQLSQQVVPLRPPPDAELAADLAELRMLRADLPGADWLSDPRAVELGDRVRHKQWMSTGAADVETRMDLDELRTRLDDDTAVLSYVYSTDGLFCVVATAATAVLVELTGWESARAALPGLRADLDMTASVRTGPMADVIRRSLDARLRELSRVLVEEPLRHTAARRLVISSPGVLAGVPWSMFPGLRGRAFTLPGSVSRWARTTSAPVQTAAFVAGPRVARAVEEVTAAAASWRSPRVRTGTEAAVAAVTALAADVDVLHIAAHGRHAADNPLFSGLELGDGVLFGYDIDRIPRVPRVVVLSACEVGRSSVRWGEEAVGMTRAWLHAGAECVIAAPVVVADDDACELLAAMHTHLAGGARPAEALAAAQRETGIVAPFQCHGAGL